jgi:ribosomal protein S18 acetylase RimI-like enzyme
MLNFKSMIIKKPNKLTKNQLEAMEALVQICGKHDETEAALDVDESFKAPNDVNSFLLYEEDQLLSFINCFAPKTYEAELSAFTHPEYRKKGLFRKLLTAAKAELVSRGISDILFVCDRKSKDGQSVASHLKAVYDFSEYSMQYTSEYKISTLVPNLRVRAAVPEDSSELVNLSRLSFSESDEDADNYIKHIFSSKNRTQHVAVMDDKIAGMISTAIEGKKSYIHGLCVSPEYRKRGIGGALLDYKVGQSLMRHPDFAVELEVETQNDGALSIYERAGFEVKACYDYFRKIVSD